MAGLSEPIRGPLPPSLEPNTYFACLGAAQTFGCFCPNPYPSILAARLGLPALNLGFGGAGPELFLRRSAAIEYAARARFVVLQIMSGRSASNSVFESRGRERLIRRADGRSLGADEAYRGLLAQEASLHLPVGGRRSLFVLPRPTERLARIVQETREDWLASYRKLIDAIDKPVICLYLSRRQPDYEPNCWTLHGFFGDFPQLVNREMVRQVGDWSDSYAECVSARGLPQPLFDRDSGAPAQVEMGVGGRRDLDGVWSENAYYPSPEMHEDAAESLDAACRPFL